MHQAFKSGRRIYIHLPKFVNSFFVFAFIVYFMLVLIFREFGELWFILQYSQGNTLHDVVYIMYFICIMYIEHVGTNIALEII